MGGGHMGAGSRAPNPGPAAPAANHSQASGGGPAAPVPTPNASAPRPAVEWSSAQWKSKITSLISDWIKTKDKASTTEAWDEYPAGLDRANNVVEFALERGCDSSDSERLAIAELLDFLAEEKKLEPANFIDPLYRSVLEFLDDFVIDIPTIHANLSQLLGPQVARGTVNLATLEGQCSHATPQTTSKLFLALSTDLAARGSTELSTQAKAIHEKLASA